MNPGEMLLNILAHSLLDRATLELNFPEFLTKLDFSWEIDLGQQWLEQASPYSINCCERTQQKYLGDFNALEDSKSCQVCT